MCNTFGAALTDLRLRWKPVTSVTTGRFLNSKVLFNSDTSGQKWILEKPDSEMALNQTLLSLVRQFMINELVLPWELLSWILATSPENCPQPNSEESPSQAIQDNISTIQDRPSISLNDNCASACQQDKAVLCDIDPSGCHPHLWLIKKVIDTNHFVHYKGREGQSRQLASFQDLPHFLFFSMHSVQHMKAEEREKQGGPLWREWRLVDTRWK